QDAWVGVLRGISRFEGRSSVRTWLFRILVNRARTTGTRERRSTAIGDAGPAVEQSRFGLDGQWISPPEHWIEESDDRLTAAKMADRIRSALDALPARRREVVTLRELEGLSREEVCTVRKIWGQPAGLAAPRPQPDTPGSRDRIREDLIMRLRIRRRGQDIACRQAVELVTEYPPRGASGQLPALRRVPRADARDHPADWDHHAR